ncbi:DNA (cytosine-5-)-methyltransferase [Reichenbachiella carrageenanivorans]|uniref:Carboxy-S-adenosyl-L-methionine synthase n=1 Tax=Reichenbachiella carrageenanivorans TaxID=2979869 RepID=A0ABY6D759_9BACT|nr:DNA (cytosine-5-)-methyltransferase [Reichenbachiella carrageenanivorans]UXX80893.1 DNA (cytosine-5-)-methyltransferase [Reichenbachiella carrageenanivorans]
MKKDEVFKESKEEPFAFKNEVATVFDDMASRSIPGYESIQEDVARIVQQFAKPNTNIYDLGCSTATTLLNIEKLVDDKTNLIGIDESADMLEQAMKKIVKHSSRVKVLSNDLVHNQTVSNASVVLMLWVLMFVRPIHRKHVIQKIYDGLVPGGILILTEKILGETAQTNKLFMDNYYCYKKKQGYSEDEILNKRLALENVLVPFKNSENLELLDMFDHVEPFYKDKQFVGYLAIKSDLPSKTIIHLDKVSPVIEKGYEDTVCQTEKTETIPEAESFHKFSYEWHLSDVNKQVEGHKSTLPKVMSTFSCGGGSSMGYKLASCDIVANLEFDKKKNDTYNLNMNPKYSYTEMIQDFVKWDDYPKELHELDILDGSPPCKTFSTNGKREKNWGKEIEYTANTPKQLVSELFFDFINLAKRLRPKIIIAENVRGLIIGKSKLNYMIPVLKAFDAAGYFVNFYLLDASNFGVPQKRRRVFFIAVRKDLAPRIDNSIDSNAVIDYSMFDNETDHTKVYLDQLKSVLPKLDLRSTEKPIPYREIEEVNPQQVKWITSEQVKDLWNQLEPGNNFAKVHPKQHWYNKNKVSASKVIPTVIPNAPMYHYNQPRHLTLAELERAGSWPHDYNYGKSDPEEMIGRAVPPVLMAHLVSIVKEQYLKPINNPSTSSKDDAVVNTDKEDLMTVFKNLTNQSDYNQFPKPESKRSNKRYYYSRYYNLGWDIKHTAFDKGKQYLLKDFLNKYRSIVESNQEVIYKALEELHKLYRNHAKSTN